MDFLRMLEGIRTPLGEAFFLFVTNGGSEIMLLGLISILYWCFDKKLAYRLTFAYLPSALAVNIIKLTCRIERPWVLDPNFRAVEKALPAATGYSFPSGHTQNATTLFATLSYVSKKIWLKIVFFLIIPIVMFSRTYLGVHTPKDVLVSFAVSIVLVLGMNVIADKLVLTHKKRVIIATCLCLVALGTAIYTYVLYASGTIAYKDAADSFKGCGAGFAFMICWVLENRYVNFEPKCPSVWKQILKIVIGLAGVLLIKEGIKYGFNALIGPSFFTDIFRYFLMMFWAMLGMPLIIKKYFK